MEQFIPFVIVVWAAVAWKSFLKFGLGGLFLWALFQGPEVFPGLWILIGIVLLTFIPDYLKSFIPDYVRLKEDLEEANRKLDEANQELHRANRKLKEMYDKVAVLNQRLKRLGWPEDDSSEDY